MDIIVGGPLKPNGQNVPTRVGELINSISEIRSIPNPRVGMEVWVQDENRGVRVLSLKENTISGVVVPNAMVDKWEYIDARLQGASEESDPMADPFVKLFAGNSGALAEVLNSTTNNGRYRIVLNNFMHVDLNVWVKQSTETVVQTIEGFIKKYEGGIDVSEERNRYLRTGIKSDDGVTWNAWEVISGSSVKKMLDKNIDDINNEITRATQAEQANTTAINAEVERAKGVEGELVKRILGTSINSSALNDSFVKKVCSDFVSLKSFLNEECISSATYNGMTNRVRYTGHTKLYLTSSLWADVYLYARDYTNGCYSQVVKGNICIEEGELVALSKPNMPYVTAWRVANNNVWGKWQTTDGNLVGKSIAFFGGSQCHLAAGSGSLTQYTDTNKTNTIKENVGYIREQLEYYGANIKSFAVQGTGFLRPIENQTILTQASSAGVYDIYVIWASTNDWVMGRYSLGEFDDFQKDGKVETVCGGLNATISTLIAKNKKAKIYVFLPMKAVDTRGFDFNNGKYGNAMFDAVSPYWKNPMGYTFGEYINAVIKVCTYRGVAVVDTFSAPNLMYQTIINSDTTGLYWNEGLLSDSSDLGYNANYVGYFIHPRRAGYAAVWGVVKKSLLGNYGEHIVQQAAIYSEQERAKAAEQLNASAIRDEVTRAEAAEQTLNNAITAEKHLTPNNGQYVLIGGIGKIAEIRVSSSYSNVLAVVMPGESYIITSTGAGYAKTWATLDGDMRVVRYLETPNSSEGYDVDNFELTIEEGESYLVVNRYRNSSFSLKRVGSLAGIGQATAVCIQQLAAKGRQLALHDLFVAAGALYNETNAAIERTAPWGESVQHLARCYYLNGLGDITEEQMATIYNNAKNVLYAGAYAIPYNGGRTVFANIGQTNIGLALDLTALCCLNKNLEVFGNSNTPIIYLNKGSLQSAFTGCTALKHIPSKHIYVKGTNLNNAFKNCTSLITVYFQRLSTNISFGDSPNISKDSILYLIEKAQPDTAITITLHADAHARLVDDEEIVAALAAQPLITLVSA